MAPMRRLPLAHTVSKKGTEHLFRRKGRVYVSDGKSKPKLTSYFTRKTFVLEAVASEHRIHPTLYTPPGFGPQPNEERSEEGISHLTEDRTTKPLQCGNSMGKRKIVLTPPVDTFFNFHVSTALGHGHNPRSVSRRTPRNSYSVDTNVKRPLRTTCCEAMFATKPITTRKGIAPDFIELRYIAEYVGSSY